MGSALWVGSRFPIRARPFLTLLRPWTCDFSSSSPPPLSKVDTIDFPGRFKDSMGLTASGWKENSSFAHERAPHFLCLSVACNEWSLTQTSTGADFGGTTEIRKSAPEVQIENVVRLTVVVSRLKTHRLFLSLFPIQHSLTTHLL